jgi:outer membrane protein TolC
MHAARPLHFLTTLLLAGLLALPACAPRTGTTTLPAEVPDAFSQTGELELPEKWWTALGDTALNRVMDTALTENFNLVVGWERLRAARALADRESAALWPDLEANMQAGASFPQPDFVGGENVRLNLQSQYEVDL